MSPRPLSPPDDEPRRGGGPAELLELAVHDRTVAREYSLINMQDLTNVRGVPPAAPPFAQKSLARQELDVRRMLRRLEEEEDAERERASAAASASMRRLNHARMLLQRGVRGRISARGRRQFGESVVKRYEALPARMWPLVSASDPERPPGVCSCLAFDESDVLLAAGSSE